MTPHCSFYPKAVISQRQTFASQTGTREYKEMMPGTPKCSLLTTSNQQHTASHSTSTFGFSRRQTSLHCGQHAAFSHRYPGPPATYPVCSHGNDGDCPIYHKLVHFPHQTCPIHHLSQPEEDVSRPGLVLRRVLRQSRRPIWI